MNENLFKLKKDGKMVGYMQIFAEDGEVVFRKDLIDDMDCDVWEQEICDFNSAHPFVTKDKNGKDVFAGDKIRYASEAIYKVIWYPPKFGYILTQEGLGDHDFGFWLKEWWSGKCKLIGDKEDD